MATRKNNKFKKSNKIFRKTHSGYKALTLTCQFIRELEND